MTELSGRLPRYLRLFGAVAALVTGLAVLPACGSGHFQFVADHRLHITAPRARSTVSLPMTVRWSFDDFQVGQVAGSFGVFIDRTPIPAGKDLKWVARKDESCQPRTGCPDESYFTSRQIFTTTKSEMTFAQLPKPGSHYRGPENHTVTVVLLDADGHRVGESAWYVDFKVHREKPS